MGKNPGPFNNRGETEMSMSHAEKNSVVQVIRRSRGNVPKQIVMFPFGGGSGYSYMGMLTEIHNDVEVVVVNPPGHLFNAGKPLESIDAMVYLYLKELRPVLKDNCLFFSHSIGSLVAYELCKDLEKEMNIKKIIISSVNPPHRVMDSMDLHSQMDTETLIKKSAELGGMPEIFASEPQLLEMFIGGLRADLKALERYTAGKTGQKIGPRIKTNAVVLYGDRDYIVNPEKLQEWRLYVHCTEFIKFPGDHFYLFEDANKKAVGQVLMKYVN
jgi:surfactin synthase thioesterase subunit